MPEEEERTTIKLVLDREAVKTLQALQEMTRRATMGEVLRDAVGVYWSLAEMKRDYSASVLALVTPDKKTLREIRIPTLESKT